MLKFIFLLGFVLYPLLLISKHLMLKFIKFQTDCGYTGIYFKTSYVEVYPGAYKAENAMSLFQNILC